MSWWCSLTREELDAEVARRERERLFKPDGKLTTYYCWSLVKSGKDQQERLKRIAECFPMEAA
jgi:hypothetical protein